MSFPRPFLLGTVFFRTALRCSGVYHLERLGMQLHDAVGAQLLKTKAQESSIWAKGCSDLTCSDLTCREKVMVYYYFPKFVK